MEAIVQKLTTLLNLMGLDDAKVVVDEEHRKVSLYINDGFVQENLAQVLPAFEHLMNLILKHDGFSQFVVDVNSYRKERERLIVELARAAARKAVATKQEIELPPMNSYERRLVHVEITTHPELTTESMGVGKDRHVVIKRVG